MLRLKDKYRFTFALNVKKDFCPSCKHKTLRLFLDKQTGQVLNNNFGICDRINTCNFKRYPSPKNIDTHLEPSTIQVVTKKKQVQYKYKLDQAGSKITPYIPSWILKEATKDNSTNDLFNFLCSKFPRSIVQEVFKLYKIGTTKNGSCIFPYLDFWDNFQAAQVRKYNDLGKGQGQDNTLTNIYKIALEKKNRSLPIWLDDYLKYAASFGVYNCLFGEHLLRTEYTKDRPIWLVESPKTALIATIFFKTYNKTQNIPLLLSCRTLSDYKEKLVQILKSYKFVVIPDLGKGFEIWDKKTASFIEQGYYIETIDIRKVFDCTQEDIKQGLDLADYLLKD